MILREMLVDDLDQVMEIEEELFFCSLDKRRISDISYERECNVSCCGRKKAGSLGIAAFLLCWTRGDVTNVAVRRDRQREGIGNFLMESMIRLAEERGITMIHLEVRAGNETAIRLYERQGFVRDGLRKAYYTDPTEDAVLMTRTAS